MSAAKGRTTTTQSDDDAALIAIDPTSGRQAEAASDNAPDLLAHLSADRPIERSADDRLQRSGFSGQVAQIIAQWRGRDSLVIGLFGAWGSGKTSLTNMIVEALKGKPSIEVVQFNPWQWSGHEELTAAFSRRLGRS
jgi:predicted KAP-like P-loop ATPase